MWRRRAGGAKMSELADGLLYNLRAFFWELTAAFDALLHAINAKLRLRAFFWELLPRSMPARD